ncbi:MAG: GNAT family N-acetyltransferase [Nitrosopumilus sp.]|nr:GNAT family N-acetyltransferase [Nitrosopumilus sp.]MDH3737084.1 GNAT family N-acetyltransferase [Nitrosopumilus sp.]MDH3822415.1 GNAT family N-acetyltransferase [Nitrosopumilus sp.]MDH3833692.1 GNAT family N-acetyltransferase [Nitrosopumilus sp.]
MFPNTYALRDEIQRLADSEGLNKPCFKEMLEYTVQLFETQGLGSDYYGYHNIDHELEVTYITLLAASKSREKFGITQKDLEYLYTASLFHDFDPQKSVDKPHEDSVIKFISLDKNLKNLLDQSQLDIELITVLILRTTYPWSGKLKEYAEGKIKDCFKRSEITKNDEQIQEHFMTLGWFLSIVDRVSGYALGDFAKAMEMAKKNAHALAWHPSVVTQRSVAYFEELLNKEGDICQSVLCSLPNSMRKNFMNAVLSFMKSREKEIKIKSEFVFGNINLVSVADSMNMRNNSDFLRMLFSIYNELPKPLQLARIGFTDSITTDKTILCTLRINGDNGKIIGFAKGGPLESYKLRSEIEDENYLKQNTVFLEPIAIKMGYWGLGAGTKLRDHFYLQAKENDYQFLTSYGLRDVIRDRISKEDAEFVIMFDPEHWDYYRVNLTS